MIRLVLISLLPLAACEAADTAAETRVRPDYMGVQTKWLDGDLVQFFARVSGTKSGKDASDYAECAAAQYTLIRGYGFARHLRTNVAEEGGVWAADAVYTISPSLPSGLRTIDAEVVVAACAENGIPTV